MIPYASFEVQMFSLEIKDDNELGLLRDKIEQAVKAIHPEMKYDSDVNVEILEHAGKCFDHRDCGRRKQHHDQRKRGNLRGIRTVFAWPFVGARPVQAGEPFSLGISNAFRQHQSASPNRWSALFDCAAHAGCRSRLVEPAQSKHTAPRSSDVRAGVPR